MNKEDLLSEFEKLPILEDDQIDYTGCDFCKSCIACMSCSFCLFCTNCIECDFCIRCLSCIRCAYCILCKGLKNKPEGYWILNKQVSKEEYLEVLKLFEKG